MIIQMSQLGYNIHKITFENASAKYLLFFKGILSTQVTNSQILQYNSLIKIIFTLCNKYFGKLYKNVIWMVTACLNMTSSRSLTLEYCNILYKTAIWHHEIPLSMNILRANRKHEGHSSISVSFAAPMPGREQWKNDTKHPILTCIHSVYKYK